MKTIKIFSLLLFGTALVTSCNKKDDDKSSTANLSLTINGLEDLGPGYAYEGWIIVNGAPVTTGVFDVDGNGELSQTSFTLNKKTLKDASTFVLTIEPVPDPDPAPSKVHILGGDFSNNIASLSVGHSTALGTNFANSMGDYILATPTNESAADEKSGVWFIDNSSSSPVAGLDLPVLPEGWEYEGWVVINGQPLTTGKFTSVNSADDATPFSGALSGPPFPGEDFLLNAPAGLTFPTDLSGSKVVISVEPFPDNSEAPFLLKPLVGDIPQSAIEHTVYSLGNNASNTNPTGSARISIN